MENDADVTDSEPEPASGSRPFGRAFEQVTSVFLLVLTASTVPILFYLHDRAAPRWLVAGVVVAGLFFLFGGLALNSRLAAFVTSLGEITSRFSLAVEQPVRAVEIVSDLISKTSRSATQQHQPAVVEAGRIVSSQHVKVVQQEAKITPVERSHLDVRNRLDDAIVKLGGRINQNLILGSMFALGGIITLVVFVLRAPAVLSGPQIFGYFAPRLTTTVFVEMLSYFFLRLYRSGLADMKFYQNELTTIELRYSAIQIALEGRDHGLLRYVISRLLLEERNRTLSAGETTLDLQRLALESKESPGLTGVIERLAEMSVDAAKQKGTSLDTTKQKGKTPSEAGQASKDRESSESQ